MTRAAATNLRLTASDRLLIIAPHPDDEVIAAGGLLHHAQQVGAQVRILFLTRGENNPWAQLLVEGRWPLRARDRERWGVRRCEESLKAIATLGIPATGAHFLGLPDQGLADLYMRGDGRPTRALAAEAEMWRPSVVVAPTISDPHPDHGAAAIYLEEALERAANVRPRLRLSFSYFDTSRVDARYVLDLPVEVQELKRRAILCHASQLRWRSDRFLAAVRPQEAFQSELPVPTEMRPPFREIELYPRVLRVWLDRMPSGVLGTYDLWISLHDDFVGAIRLSVRIPAREDRAFVRDLLREVTVGRATIDRASCLLEVPLSVGMARGGFLRLDRPLLRHLGFIYGYGWQRLALMRAET